MVRYLSPAWLSRLEDHESSASSHAPGDVVLRQVVTGTPEGASVHYDVVVAGGRATLWRAASRPPDVTVTSDYATASAVASGRLSTFAALAAGGLTVSGDMAALASAAASAAGLDPLPAGLRADTEFPGA